MKSKILPLVLLGITFAVHAVERITIEETEYFLANTEVDKKEGFLKEFLVEGEALDNWVTLVAVREFYTTKSPKKYIHRMAAEYRKRLPHMQFAVMQDPDSENWMIDYILYPYGETEGYAEWNYFKAMPNPNGKGVLVGQFVRRHPYHGSLENVFKEWNIGEYRSKMLGTLLSHQFEIHGVEVDGPQ